MKTKLLFTLFLIGIFLSATSQSPYFQWAKGFPASGSPGSFGQSIKVDASGNNYVTGCFSGTMDVDPGPSTFVLTAPLSTYGFFILKLDPSGNFRWAKTLTPVSGNGGGIGYSLALDNTGGVLTTGVFNGIMDFDPGAGTSTLAVTDGRVFVLKLDTTGNFIWAKNFGASTNGNGPVPSSLDVDPQGNIYTSGSFKNTSEFDPGPASYTLTTAGIFNSYILKLTNAGNFVWAKQFVSSSNNMAPSIHIDNAGNILTTGPCTGNVDFDPDVTTYTLNVSNNSTYICKLNSSGNFTWVKILSSTSGVAGTAVAADPHDNIIVTGAFSALVDFDPAATSYTLDAPGTSNIYVLKLSPSGIFRWAKAFSGPNAYGSCGTGLDFDPTGNVYSSGIYYDTLDFDPGVGTQTLSSKGSADSYISKLDSLGNYVWIKTMGGSFSESCTSLAVMQNGNVYSTGSFADTCNFNIGGPSYTLNFAASENSFYVHKIGQCDQPASPTDITPFAKKNICANEKAILSASGSGTFKWYSTSTSTSAIASGATYTTWPLGTGSFTYYVEAFTCVNSASRTAVTVSVSDCTDIGSFETENSFSIFPNPCKDQLSFESSYSSELSVFSIDGKLVLKQHCDKGQSSIVTTELNAGIYILHIQTEHQVWRNRFVKAE